MRMEYVEIRHRHTWQTLDLLMSSGMAICAVTSIARDHEISDASCCKGTSVKVAVLNEDGC